MPSHDATGGRRPELAESLPDDLARPVRRAAETLRAAGHRAWIVGGCVRDLLWAERGHRAPVKDADLVSAALPDEVERLFERTVAVGKSFGIVVVVLDGVELEVATFREERGYSDRRRPDEIRFTDSLALDARRRDFTINALYLDPLDGQIEDPTGGLADLEAGVLRAVGDPVDRFREDGLRILRMARFQSRFGLAPAPGLHDAARAEGDALQGVSPERVLDEIAKMVAGGGAAEALGVLHTVGALVRVLPEWSEADAEARLRDLGALGPERTVPAALAALLGADGPDAARRRVAELRASRDTVRRAGQIVELAQKVDRMAGDGLDGAGEGEPSAPSAATSAEVRGARVLLVRDPLFDAATRLAVARSDRGDELQRFIGAAVRASADAPAALPTLSAADLVALGMRPGPELGVALRRVECAAAGGAFADREGALAWARSELLGGEQQPST